MTFQQFELIRIETHFTTTVNSQRFGRLIQERIALVDNYRINQLIGISLKNVIKVEKGFSILELLFIVAIVGMLSAIATIALSNYIYKTKVARCIVEIQMIVKEITIYKNEKNTLPIDLTVIHREPLLDPWGNPYQYLNIATGNKGNLRKDHNLVPINTDYDLYSMGADGDSKPPLTAKSSHDDIIRANDGAYVGLASNY